MAKTTADWEDMKAERDRCRAELAEDPTWDTSGVAALRAKLAEAT